MQRSGVSKLHRGAKNLAADISRVTDDSFMVLRGVVLRGVEHLCERRPMRRGQPDLTLTRQQSLHRCTAWNQLRLRTFHQTRHPYQTILLDAPMDVELSER